VVAEADAVAQLRDGLSRALEANERLAVLAEELSGENARLRERLAQRDAELEQMAAELAVLKRMVFGRSSEKGREPAGQGDGGQGGAGHDGAGGTPRKRGRAGNSRRDYSHLPRFEIIWDFEDGSYCCPRCGRHCQLVELWAVDGHVESGLDARVDLCSGAQAAAVAVPVTSFQVVNRVSISRRYSWADSRWRRGRKCEDIPENADRNRCACPGEVNFRIARSRARVGWWEFSARLFRYFDRRCSTPGISRRWATP
jgi:hypothetical protein